MQMRCSKTEQQQGTVSNGSETLPMNELKLNKILKFWECESISFRPLAWSSIGRDSAQGAIGAAVGGTSLVRSHWLVRIKGCGQPYSCGDSWCFSESKDCVAAVVKVQVRVVFQPVNHTGVATAFTIMIYIYIHYNLYIYDIYIYIYI